MTARTFTALAFSISILASGCGGGGSVTVDGPPLAVYKSFGAKQCEGGGLTLAALTTQLTSAGVSVTSAKCGHDGMAYIAVCGAPTGTIGILEVPQSQGPAAAALGFAPLATLPNAAVQPCPPG